MNRQCSGCGAPRSSFSPFCRYCRALLADTQEMALAVQQARRDGVPSVPVARARQVVPGHRSNFSNPIVPREDVQIAQDRRAPMHRRSSFRSVDLVDFLVKGFVNVLCVLIVVVPVSFVAWSMAVVVLGQ